MNLNGAEQRTTLRTIGVSPLYPCLAAFRAPSSASLRPGSRDSCNQNPRQVKPQGNMAALAKPTLPNNDGSNFMNFTSSCWPPRAFLETGGGQYSTHWQKTLVLVQVRQPKQCANATAGRHNLPQQPTAPSLSASQHPPPVSTMNQP